MKLVFRRDKKEVRFVVEDISLKGGMPLHLIVRIMRTKRWKKVFG